MADSPSAPASSNVLGKLGVQNRVEAVATASRAGLTLDVEPIGSPERA